MPPAVEICVIFADPTFYLEEQVAALKNLINPDFRVLYVPDRELPGAWLSRLRLDQRFRIVPSGKASIPVKRNFCLKNLLPQTDWVAFMDDDGYPPPDWTQRLQDCLLKNPGLMAFGGPALPPPGTGWRERAVGLAIESYVGRGASARWGRPLPAEISVSELPSCNLIVRRSFFDRPGTRFDEGLSIGEDAEWCRRASRVQGFSLRMFPELFIFNHHRPLFIPVFLQFFRYGSYRMKIILSAPKAPAREWLAVSLPMGLALLPLAAYFFPGPAGAMAALYLAVVVIEGLAMRKSPVEHLLRALAIPIIHLSYAMGIFARLLRLPQAEVKTYVRTEAMRDPSEAP